MPRPSSPPRIRVVTVGGGTGQATLLAALRRVRIPLEVCAVVGVTDDGGHSGVLRRSLRIPQVGDLRSCLASLAPDTPLARLVRHRFREDGLDGVQLGNLLLAALVQATGRLSLAAGTLRALLGVRERVIPVSDGDAHVVARLPGDRTVTGEWAIIRALSARARRVANPRREPVRLSHAPRLTVTGAAAEALRRADFLLLAPGSLRTALGSLLRVRGVHAAIGAGRARTVAILNLMTQHGNTDGFTAADHLRELETWLPRPVDVAVMHRGPLPAALVRRYRDFHAAPVVDDLGTPARPLVVRAPLAERPDRRRLRAYARGGKGLVAGPHLLRHDPGALARVLTSLFRTP